MITIQHHQLLQLLKEVSQNKHVLAPVMADDKVLFVPWQEETKIEWRQNSVLPPKDIIFPRVDVLYSYELVGADINFEQDEVDEAEEKEILLFGIRSCDARSLKLMDKVFLGADYPDPGYKKRRNSTILIALGCADAASTCFCGSLGVNAMGGDGADLVLLPLETTDILPDSTFGVEILSEMGNEFYNEHTQYFKENSERNPLPSPNFKLNFETTGIPEKLSQMFEHKIWEKLSRRCIACGVCTYLCPSCHCFDIHGTTTSFNTGMRFRCWDSCMFSDYTLMAGGHDPRPSRVERFRNRFLHKLSYFNERYGELMCTGCGRCLAWCPVHMDLSYVVDKIREAEIDAK